VTPYTPPTTPLTNSQQLIQAAMDFLNSLNSTATYSGFMTSVAPYFASGLWNHAVFNTPAAVILDLDTFVASSGQHYYYIFF
jgi:hypothetical protein